MRRTALAMMMLVAAVALPLSAEADGSAGSVGSAGSAGDPPVVLGRFTTTYAFDADHKSRAFNVELAAEALDGKTIAPGATFSFNDAVGERTAAFGFSKANVIRDGMIAEGTGGGTCQVASTLHAAALLSALEMVSRAPHTRPSAYIRMGLDATVAFPSSRGVAIDLKLRNPMSEPVLLHARAAKGTLDVWLDAKAAASKPNVTLTSEIIERSTFTRVVERDKSIADDKVHIKAFGIPGFRVRRMRDIRSADGTLKRDVRFDVYAPTNEVVRVSPSFDEARLSTSGHKEPMDEDDTLVTAAERTPDANALRPVLVQLRPSTQVILENTTH